MKSPQINTVSFPFKYAEGKCGAVKFHCSLSLGVKEGHRASATAPPCIRRREKKQAPQQPTSLQTNPETNSPAPPDMARWGDAKLVFCIFFFITCCTVSQAQMAMDCCLKVKDQAIDKKVVVDYHHQISGQGCAIDSTIFVTRHGRKLCVPPASAPWVLILVEHVDHLKTVCKKRKYKGNRCFGVKPE